MDRGKILLLLASSLIPCGGIETGEGEYFPATRVGTITDVRVRELSGMVPVTGAPGHFWIHNDSDDGPRIFAIEERGIVVAEVTIPGASHVDWEDIATGPGPVAGKIHLHIADSGNNAVSRTVFAIYRLPEPELESLRPGQRLTSSVAEILRYRYPDGSHDSESLVVHPGSGTLYVVTKAFGTAGVYRFPDSRADGAVKTLIRVGSLRPGDLITAADLSGDGRCLLIRTYSQVQQYRLPANRPFEEIFLQSPAVLPGAVAETKSESICFDHDDRDILTSNEGSPAPIHRIQRKVEHPICEPPAGAAAPFTFVRGEVNEDGNPDGEARVNVTDAVALLDSIESGSPLPCQDSADINDDGVLNRQDVLDLLEALVDDRSPPPPFPGPGVDATADDLTCHVEARVLLVEENAAWRYRDASTPPTADWREVGADDTSWLQGRGGIGTGVTGLGTTLPGTRARLYARHLFQLAGPPEVDALILELDYNDGFVAYLNGVEVARRGLGDAGYDVPAGTRARSHPGGAPESFFLCPGLLRAGPNLLALEIHNRLPTDRTLFFRARLLGQTARQSGPPAPGGGEPPAARLFFAAESPPNVGDRSVITIRADSAAPIRGLSLGVLYEPARLRILRVDPGQAMQSLPAAWERYHIDESRGIVSYAALADPESATGTLVPAGQDLELARLVQIPGSAAGTRTSLRFTRREGVLPLESCLVVRADGNQSVKPAVEPIDLEITDVGRPVIEGLVSASGGPGSRFYVLGRRLDHVSLEVRVCGQTAEFKLLSDLQTLRVVAPPCNVTGPAAVEVCSPDGCDVAAQGFDYTELGPPWIRGDANGDGKVDISDAIALLGDLFLGVPSSPICGRALDVNNDGAVDITDPIFLLSFLFQGGTPIPAPFPGTSPCTD